MGAGIVERPYNKNNDFISMGDWNSEPENVLSSQWRTVVPNDENPYFVRLACVGGYYWGIINRYSTNYGSFLGARYDNKILFSRMENGTIKHKYL